MIRIFNIILALTILLPATGQIRQTKTGFVDSHIVVRDDFSDSPEGVTHPAEWQIVSGAYEINENTVQGLLDVGDKYLECTSNGDVSLLYTESDAYSTMSVDFYDGSWAYHSDIIDNLVSTYSWLSLSNDNLTFSLTSGQRFTNFSIKKPEPFEFEVSLTTGDTVILPLESGYTYDFVVDWGDGRKGKVKSYNDSDIEHVYRSDGDFSISITGICETFYINASEDSYDLSRYITGITNWGETGFKLIRFSWCDQLTSITSRTVLDCTPMDSMSYLFYQCAFETIDVAEWDMSNVSIFKGMFSHCHELKYIDVARWNTSSCTSTWSMFWQDSTLLTVDISDWDMSNVTKPNSMFAECHNLITIDVTGWDTSSWASCAGIFYLCYDLTSYMPPEMFWDRAVPIDGHNSFTQDSLITNFSDIPYAWRSDL